MHKRPQGRAHPDAGSVVHGMAGVDGSAEGKVRWASTELPLRELERLRFSWYAQVQHLLTRPPAAKLKIPLSPLEPCRDELMLRIFAEGEATPRAAKAKRRLLQVLSQDARANVFVIEDAQYFREKVLPAVREHGADWLKKLEGADA